MSDLARFMFDRQAGTYDFDPGLCELAWLDPGIRDFWATEAQVITSFLDGVTSSR